MGLSLNQISKRILTFGEAHRQINYCAQDNITEFLKGSDITYPAMIIDDNDDNIVIDIENHRTVYRFSIWICDRINLSADARGNVNDVKSDLMQIGEDMVAMINSPLYQDDWDVLTSSMPITFYQEKFNDLVGAIRVDVLIGSTFLADRCSVPTDGVTFETTKDMIVNTYTYKGLGTEGSTLSTGLIGKQILYLVKGDKTLNTVDDDSVNRYQYDADTGVFTFGTDIEQGQIIQIVHRNLS